MNLPELISLVEGGEASDEDKARAILTYHIECTEMSDPSEEDQLMRKVCEQLIKEGYFTQLIEIFQDDVRLMQIEQKLLQWVQGVGALQGFIKGN